MTADYPLGVEPATPEYVLAVLCDLHRLGVLDYDVTFDTPIWELRTYLNDTILFWWELARALNECLQQDIPLAEWKPVLARGRTVRGLCELVARHLDERPVIRSWQHIAGDCRPAGAFLTVRSLLARDGADPDEITPNTELEPYLRRSDGRWILPLYAAVPGRVPEADFVGPPLSSTAKLSLIAFGMVPLGLLLNSLDAKEIGGWVLILACLGGLVLMVSAMFIKRKPPRRVRMVGCRTFRDLAYRLAGQEPRRRIHQSA